MISDPYKLKVGKHGRQIYTMPIKSFKLHCKANNDMGNNPNILR